jgi:hypothetical protein
MKETYQAVKQSKVTEQAKPLNSWMGEFTLEWQGELFEAIVALDPFCSLGWGWKNKQGTARQMKRQEVWVRYD